MIKAVLLSVLDYSDVIYWHAFVCSPTPLD